MTSIKRLHLSNNLYQDSSSIDQVSTDDRDLHVSAPNAPVATFSTPRTAISVTNCSYNGSAISGLAASVKLGRRPFRQSPQSVGCLTIKDFALYVQKAQIHFSLIIFEDS